MPTYDYRCKACGHEFELFQSMTAPVKRKCSVCAKNALERLIGTGAGVIFKGSGFYETDYRSDSYQKAAEADKKAAEPATDKTSEKSSGEKTSDAAGAKATSSNGTKQSDGTSTSKGKKTSAPVKSDKSKKTSGDE